MPTQWPLSFRWALANGLKQMVPWHFIPDLDDDLGRITDSTFRKESTRDIEVRTFARRQDCDDFAGFIVESGEITDRVICFHPSFGGTKNDYLIDSEIDGFWTFLTKVVIPDTVDWASEDDLEDVTQ